MLSAQLNPTLKPEWYAPAPHSRHAECRGPREGAGKQGSTRKETLFGHAGNLYPMAAKVRDKVQPKIANTDQDCKCNLNVHIELRVATVTACLSWLNMHDQCPVAKLRMQNGYAQQRRASKCRKATAVDVNMPTH